MALIDIVPTTTMEEVLRAYPSAKVGLLVFYSNEGHRSLDKASNFRAYGFPRARSLTGGLAAWDAEVDRKAIPARAEELRE